MYGIWERVRLRHPGLILENCAGGGARTDLGMCSRFDFTWFSDYIRPMIAECCVYHHTEPLSGDQPEGWCVFEYAAPDRSLSIGALFRLAGAAAPEYRFKFRGLSRTKTYRIHMENLDETFTATGRELVEEGIVVRMGHPMTSELVLAKST